MQSGYTHSKTILHSFQMRNLDFCERDDHGRHLGEVDQAICGRLHEDVGSEGHTAEAELSEGNVDIEAAI